MKGKEFADRQNWLRGAINTSWHVTIFLREEKKTQ